MVMQIVVALRNSIEPATVIESTGEAWIDWEYTFCTDRDALERANRIAQRFGFQIGDEE
jgi:hypothetical protein